jgi:hypothetical protein
MKDTSAGMPGWQIRAGDLSACAYLPVAALHLCRYHRRSRAAVSVRVTVQRNDLSNNGPAVPRLFAGCKNNLTNPGESPELAADRHACAPVADP